jgi:transcriptional regulator with XRE-family HTH domain
MGDRLQLLLGMVEAKGQARVARELGVDPGAISKIRRGVYEADPGKILAKVAEVYGTETVFCPAFGEAITLKRCTDERSTPFSPNPRRVRIRNACRNCERGKG